MAVRHTMTRALARTLILTACILATGSLTQACSHAQIPSQPLVHSQPAHGQSVTPRDAGAAAPSSAHPAPASQAPATSASQETRAMSLPKASRRPPPDVPPIEFKGLRYEQEMQGIRHGLDQSTGYLVAIDPATNERRWVLKVYETSNVPGLEQDVQRRYFKRMTLLEGRDVLEIESETGQRYIVDLIQRTVTPAP